MQHIRDCSTIEDAYGETPSKEDRTRTPSQSNTTVPGTKSNSSQDGSVAGARKEGKPDSIVINSTSRDTCPPQHVDERLLEYPNGDVVISAKRDEGDKRVPIIGWAMRTYSTYRNKTNGRRKIYKHCLGVFSCIQSDCTYVARPMAVKKASDAHNENVLRPKDASCPTHRCSKIVWNRCSCRIILSEGDASWTLRHFGTHDHAKPSPVRVTRPAWRDLNSIVNIAPELVPSQLTVGSATRSPVGQSVHKMLNNTGTVQYVRSKILRDQGMPSTMTALLRLQKDSTEPFIRSSSMDLSNAFISMQTNSMIDLISAAETPMETDSVHDFIVDKEFVDEINVTITSTYDVALQRTVPVCVSIMFGKSAKHYKAHFRQVLMMIQAENASEYLAKFPGMTCDMSDAERVGFKEAIQDVVGKRYGQKVSNEQIAKVRGYAWAFVWTAKA